MPDVRAIIAVITTLGTMALMAALVYYKSDQLNTAMGFYFGFWAGVGTYYFGSSKGSSEKDETISKIAMTGNPGSTTPPLEPKKPDPTVTAGG